ncbi:MAG: DUF4126 domain-containing protein [Segetibacter sp.]|jgi:hypothetical protein|nr:DUF4126 domain-containing protein [Segetibacter sp.]
MDYSILTNIAMGIALSACAGFRVFIPMLAGALAGHFNIISLPNDMEWLSSWPAIACFGTAAVAEVSAYYIPFIDNLLDTIATPLSVGAGTVLASSILPIGDQEPLVRWGIGFLAGGSVAGTIQMGTGLLRLFSSKATLGTGNAIVATTENAAALSISALSFFIPVVIAILVIALIVWIIVKLTKRFSKKPVRV